MIYMPNQNWAGVILSLLHTWKLMKTQETPVGPELHGLAEG